MGVFKVNRASLVGVKNRLFGIDVEQSAQLAVCGKLVDSLTYAMITLFRVVEHYSQHLSQNALGNLNGPEQTMQQLKEKVEQLRQNILGTSGLLIARKNKLTHHSTRGDLGGQQLKQELKSMSKGLLLELDQLLSYVGDLVLLSNCVERDCFLDLFKCDVVLLQCKMTPSVQALASYLEQFARFPGRSLDKKTLDVRSTEIFEMAKSLRSMLRSNCLLIQEFQAGEITMTEFLIKRNEFSLKYIDLSPRNEMVFGEALVYVSDVQFLFTIATDALKVTETLTMHCSHALNTVQSSMELFFKLSNVIEVDLYMVTSAFRTNPTPDFTILTALLLRLESILTTCAMLTAESLALREFLIDEPLLRQTVTKTHNLRICLQLLINLCSMRSNDIGQFDDKSYQHRFSTLIGSLSLCTMGLGETVGRYVDKL